MCGMTGDAQAAGTGCKSSGACTVALAWELGLRVHLQPLHMQNGKPVGICLMHGDGVWTLAPMLTLSAFAMPTGI